MNDATQQSVKQERIAANRRDAMQPPPVRNLFSPGVTQAVLATSSTFVCVIQNRTSHENENRTQTKTPRPRRRHPDFLRLR